MDEPISPTRPVEALTKSESTLGFYTAILTSVLTLVTFGIAFFTPPISGPSCQADCITYPFIDIVTRFPRDYIWMYPTMLLMVLFVVLMVCIHHFAPTTKKVFSHLGLAFALISAAVLLTNYFVQVSVIQPSVVNGETDGIALLTQYNPHGIFIALEELGFLLMSLAFFCIAPVFSGANRVERALRWIFRLSFVLTLGALIGLSFAYGIHRSYLFEIAVITIDWMTLIISGILLSLVFRKAAEAAPNCAR